MVNTLAIMTLLALASCGYGASLSNDCAISCSSGACPSGFACTGGLCRSPGSVCADVSSDGGEDGASNGGDGSPGDIDGDGVPDAVDNCPTVYNPDQANEDGDKFGDVCDPCPPVADDDPLDSDGDGVADACDPNPGTPTDKIYVFEGFHSGLAPGWAAAGSWTSDGQGDIVATADGAVAASLTIPAPASGHETVSASVTVLDIANGAYIGVVDDYLPAASGLSCRLYFNGTSPYFQLADIGVTDYGTALYQMTVGVTYLLSERRDATEFGCNAERSDMSDPVTIPMSASSRNNASPEIGLRVELNTTMARYQWVMVVSSQ